MDSSSASDGSAKKKTGSQLTRAVQVLETLAKFLPGHLATQTALAKARLAGGNSEEALKILEQTLHIDPSHTSGHLLMARTYYERDDVGSALRILEQGMSKDFGIRSHSTW